MSFSLSLLAHAVDLVTAEYDGAKASERRSISDRRAVSAAYYALFHHINSKAVDLIAPNVQPETNHRIQRWFEHSEMKKVCGRFLQTKLDQPLLGLIGPTASPELQHVASSFIKLQDARHSADYDLSYSLSPAEAHQFMRLAVTAMESWDQIAKSAEANIFILSLLLWKNWDKER